MNCGSEIIPGPAREGIFCCYIVWSLLISRLLRMNSGFWDHLWMVFFFQKHVIVISSHCWKIPGYYILFNVLSSLLLMAFGYLCLCVYRNGVGRLIYKFEIVPIPEFWQNRLKVSNLWRHANTFGVCVASEKLTLESESMWTIRFLVFGKGKSHSHSSGNWSVESKRPATYTDFIIKSIFFT